MAKAATPDQPKKTPATLPKGAVEIADILDHKKKTPDTPEAVHAEARAKSQDLQTEVVKKRLAEIDKRQKEIEKEIGQSQGKPLIQEDWVKKEVSTGIIDGVKDSVASGKINSKIDEKFGKYQPLLDALGIGDQAETVKQLGKNLVFEYWQKSGRDESATDNYGNNTIDDKMMDFLTNLKTLAESIKPPLKNRKEIVVAFSKFSKTNVLDDLNGNFNTDKLKELLTTTADSLKEQLKNFSSNYKLIAEKNALEEEKSKLISSPAAAPQQKLEAPAEKPAPRTPEKPAQQPAATPTSQPAGTPPATPATAPEAQKPAEKPAEPLDFGKSFMDVLKWLFSLFGMKFGQESAAAKADIMREWKDATDEEKKEVPKFFEALKGFFPDMEKEGSNSKANILNLLNNPTETRSILTARKKEPNVENPTEAVSWRKYLENHLSRSEQNTINTSSNMNATSIQALLVSPIDFKNELPASAIEQKPPEPGKAAEGTPEKPAAPDTPASIPGNSNVLTPEGGLVAAAQLDAALEKMDKDPWMVSLKAIMDDYIVNQAAPDMAANFKKAKEDPSQKIYIDGYMEFLGMMYERKNPDAKEKFETGELRTRDILLKVYEELFTFTMAKAKTPEEKQKATETLTKFKDYISKIDDSRRVTRPKNKPTQNPEQPTS